MIKKNMGNITKTPPPQEDSKLNNAPGFFLFILVLKCNIIEQKLYFYNNHFLSSEAPSLFISITSKLKVSKSDRLLVLTFTST